MPAAAWPITFATIPRPAHLARVLPGSGRSCGTGPGQPGSEQRETRNRFRMAPPSLATWELRLGELRVFYDVEGQTVRIRAVGVKQRNRLLIAGQEVDTRAQEASRPAQPDGAGDRRRPHYRPGHRDPHPRRARV